MWKDESKTGRRIEGKNEIEIKQKRQAKGEETDGIFENRSAVDAETKAGGDG